MTLVREKERGTIEQLMVSPIKSHELIIGKLIPYIIISFLDIILTVVISVFWFKVPIYGSAWATLCFAARTPAGHGIWFILRPTGSPWK